MLQPVKRKKRQQSKISRKTSELKTRGSEKTTMAMQESQAEVFDNVSLIWLKESANMHKTRHLVLVIYLNHGRKSRMFDQTGTFSA